MKRNDRWIDELRGLPLFGGCTRDELVLIARNSTEHDTPAGTVLIGEGDVGREFFVIVDGFAEVLVAGQPVARLGAGDFFGEMALLDRGVRSATVVAETDLVTRLSSPPEFAELLTGAPNLTRKLLAGVAGRLRAATPVPAV